MIEKMIKPWEFRIKRESANAEEENCLRNLTGVTPQN